MTEIFFYGILRHPPVLAEALGRTAVGRPAVLHDHVTVWHPGTIYPDLKPRPGGRTEGVLVKGITEEERKRIEYVSRPMLPTLRTVNGPEGEVEALVYLLPHAAGNEPWVFEDWVARWGDITAATGVDYMKGFGVVPASAQVARMDRMLMRGDARLRAMRQPMRIRPAAAPGDVEVEHERQPYANYFAVEEYDLSFRRFDGGMNRPVSRAVFVTGDSATVLPYDPLRDRVLLVEQFRTGPFARGDRQPWLLEPIAGRIDAGETPETTVMREAREEAGLALGTLFPASRYYSSPGCMTEYVYSFVGLADLPDDAARVAGLDEEHEDIRGHLLGFDELMRLVESGESGNAPLVTSALWLAANRERLRAAASSG